MKSAPICAASTQSEFGPASPSTSVEVTGDLREAKVYYSVLGKEDEASKAGKWLLRKRDEIREMLAKNVVIRHVPLLAFVHDNHAPRTVRIEELLSEIDRKEKEKEQQP